MGRTGPAGSRRGGRTRGQSGLGARIEAECNNQRSAEAITLSVSSGPLIYRSYDRDCRLFDTFPVFVVRK